MNRYAVETILALASCVSGHAQECKARVLQPVNDDLGNRWKAGSVLPVDIERTGPQGDAFCASRGSCLPRTVQGSDALVLLNCRKGAAVGDGDFRLVASASKTGRAAASAIERRQDVADKLSKLGLPTRRQAVLPMSMSISRSPRIHKFVHGRWLGLRPPLCRSSAPIPNANTIGTLVKLAITITLLASLCFAAPSLHAQVLAHEELVRPSQANAAIQTFDDANVVLSVDSDAAEPPLAVFLPGTHGKPMNALRLLNVVAGQGYRVIGLTYDDEPAGTQLCPRDPNPECFTGFHSMRVFGRGPAPVTNTYPESIEGRLASLLQYLNREHPNAGWSAYLTQDGRAQWSRILVSGLSQGAGMAAYIAKTVPVYRVVLFSSPWDNLGREHRPAPWLSRKSATPMERWWAERHVQENTTQWIASAYQALQIPQQHIFLFDQPLTNEQSEDARNPFHGSTIRNPAYEPQWRTMYGSAESH